MKRKKRRLITFILTAILTIITVACSVNANASSFSLNKKKVALKIGETFQLKVNATGPMQYVWKSSNKSVVTVSSTGKLRAKKAGNAIVTVSTNGKTEKCKVAVEKAPSWSKKIWKNRVSDWTMEFSSQYTTIFNSNGTVCQTGWRNKDTGYYKVISANKIKAYYTDNYVSWAGSNNPQKVNTSYTATYTYNKKNNTVYVKYSLEFYKNMNSNAKDGVLYGGLK